MKTTTLNNSISVDKTLANLLLLYLASVIFTYPYGIPIVGDNYARIPDLFALGMGGFAVTVWALQGKSKYRLQPLGAIAPFFALEIILPIIGGIYYGSFSDSLSAMRVVFLYLPIVVCCLWLGITSSLKLERRIDKLLRIATIANLVYSIIQLAVYIGILSRSFLLGTYLESFVADEHYREIQGLRTAGFFTTTTSFSVFGIVVLCYFLAKYKATEKMRYLIYLMLALILVLLSTARAAYVGIVLIFLFNIFSSKLSKSLKTISIITISVFLLLIILGNYFQIDYELFFQRFIRISEEGIEQDYSWQTRIEGIWPKVIAGMKNYPFGTLVPSYEIFGFIDSGYLTYYAQGSWLFIVGLLWFYISTFISLFTSKIKSRGWSVDFLYYLLLYIVPAMVVNNPMRSPTIVFALIYGLWFFSIEKKLVSKRFDWR